MEMKVAHTILISFLLLLAWQWITAHRPPLSTMKILKGAIVSSGRLAPLIGHERSFISGTQIFLVVSAKVGTPGQPLRLYFDFIWPYTWVIDANAEQTPFSLNKTRFNSTQSSTFFPRVDYFFSFDCEGQLAEDHFSLDTAGFPLATVEQTIGLATRVWSDIPADGSVGFSPSPTSWRGDETLAGNLFYSERYFDREHRVATLWVNSSDVFHDMHASLTLGGFDRDVCSDKGWMYSPVSTNMDWDTWVNAVRIEVPPDHNGTGGETLNGKTAVPPVVIPLRGENRTMKASPLTHFTFGPKEQIKAIMRSTGCKWMGTDCERAKKLRANVVFELEPIGDGAAPGRVVLTPRDYVYKMVGRCHCLFMDTLTEPGLQCWGLGVGVLQKYSVQMDYARQRIGFGSSKTY